MVRKPGYNLGDGYLLSKYPAPLSSTLLPFLLGEGSPTKIGYRKKIGYPYSSLSAGGPRLGVLTAVASLPPHFLSSVSDFGKPTLLVYNKFIICFGPPTQEVGVQGFEYKVFGGAIVGHTAITIRWPLDLPRLLLEYGSGHVTTCLVLLRNWNPMVVGFLVLFL